MARTDKRFFVSFRARLLLVTTALLLATLAMVQYLNFRAQGEIEQALEAQKESVNSTIDEYATDTTAATNFALMSLNKNDFIYDLLANPEYKSAINRDRIRHILVIEEDGKIYDASERELRNQYVKIPEAAQSQQMGAVVKGDPVAYLENGNDVEAETRWVRVETRSNADDTRQFYWIAIVASTAEVTNTIINSQRHVADVVESTAGARWKLTLGVFALAVGLTFLLVWRFTGPIQKLAEAAERVAGGDLDFRVEAKRRDEMGRLATTFNDMIDGLKAKSELEERLNNAERAAVIGRLTSAVAHEIRNPLNFINLSIDHVRSKYEPEGERDRERFNRLLGSIKEEIGRLNRLVNDVLNFGRPANLNARRFDLRNTIDPVVGLVRTQAEQQRVEIEVDLPDEPVEVEGDLEKLKSCFSNIVINAIQAMPEGGRLEIAMRTGDEWVGVRFRDTGSGIPEEALDRVFEPYYSTKDTGTGLGLAVTKKILDEHGGRVRVASAPGDGTTFDVELPRAASAREGAERLSVVATE
jgi:signal transduction histidine kinase